MDDFEIRVRTILDTAALGQLSELRVEVEKQLREVRVEGRERLREIIRHKLFRCNHPLAYNRECKSCQEAIAVVQEEPQQSEEVKDGE